MVIKLNWLVAKTALNGIWQKNWECFYEKKQTRNRLVLQKTWPKPTVNKRSETITRLRQFFHLLFVRFLLADPTLRRWQWKSHVLSSLMLLTHKQCRCPTPGDNRFQIRTTKFSTVKHLILCWKQLLIEFDNLHHTSFDRSHAKTRFSSKLWIENYSKALI